MKISYCIPVCNESRELKELLTFLKSHKRPEDEIVVQVDSVNKTPEVDQIVSQYANEGLIKLIYFGFKGNFADLKNNLKDQCTGDFIFQLDADEIPNPYLVSVLPTLFKHNPNVDLYLVPRINVVNGLGLNHVQKWRWKITTIEGKTNEKVFDTLQPYDKNEYELLKRYNLVEETNRINEYQFRIRYKIPIVNFPDSQTRIMRNDPQIHWVSKVHEVITGYKSHATLPLDERYTIYHEKEIDRQEKQNNFYDSLA